MHGHVCGSGGSAGAGSAGRQRRRPEDGGWLRLAGVLTVSLVLAGCGWTPTAHQAAASDAGAAAQYAADTPPAAAQMVCSDEIRGEVADALNVASVPAPTPTWADHVYTCAYAPPMGRLVLSVTVAGSGTDARRQLVTLRDRLAGAAPEAGLGEQAFGSPAGTVISRKDNMVLTVDATGLPDDLGNTHESRLNLARVITAGVFNCWTGNS